MSPQNRLRLIRLAEIVRSPRFILAMAMLETLAAVGFALLGWVIPMIVMLIFVAIDVRALAAENLLSRRSR